MSKGWLRYLPIPLLVLAAYVLWRELHGLNPNAVRHAMVQWGPGRSLAAILLSFTVYGLLAGNEQVALRWAHAHVPLRTGMRNAFIAFALANTLGFGFLVGGAFRANAYRRWGVGLGKVAQITAYGALTFTLGVLALAGGLLMHARDGVYDQLAVDPFVGRAVGGLMWVGLALYATAGALAPERVRLFKFEFKPPRPGLVAIQVFFGCADLMAGAGVFWLLLGKGAPHYSDFLSAYIISIMAGLLSGVPGGAGVFETAMLQLLPQVDRTSLAAAFLGFRVFYYFAPLAVALILLAFMKHVHDPDTEQGPVEP
ncbi:MAG: lysylphosphatidylglycerol synthase domain-containing protein [Caulobacteraceae bacterium]